MAIERDIRQPVHQPVVRAGVGDVLTLHGESAGQRLDQTDDGLAQFELAIALDAGDTEHFALADLERHIVERVLVARAGHRAAVELQTHEGADLAGSPVR